MCKQMHGDVGVCGEGDGRQALGKAETRLLLKVRSWKTRQPSTHPRQTMAAPVKKRGPTVLVCCVYLI